MKVLLFILISFTISFTLIAQPGLNIKDNKGRKQGVWKVNYPNGNIKYTGKFIDDQPVDTFKYYYAEGKLKALLIHNIRNNVAQEFTFYTDSTLMSKGKYLNKKKEGQWFYYYAGNKLLSEENYINGLKEGICKSYNMEGVMLTEYTCKMGMKEGPFKQYYHDGKVKINANYTADKLNGFYQILNADGVVRVSGHYVSNFKDGLWMYFNDKMETVRKEEYKNGNLIKEQQLINMPSPFDNPPVPDTTAPASNSIFDNAGEIDR